MTKEKAKQFLKHTIIVSIFFLPLSKSQTLECYQKNGNLLTTEKIDLNSSEPIILAEAFKDYCETVDLTSFHIGSFSTFFKSSKTSEFLGTSFYVNYKKIQAKFTQFKENTENWVGEGEFTRPLINVIQVNEEEIWFRSFNQTWGGVLSNIKSNIKLQKVFTKNEDLGKITAFYHYDGLEQLVLGFENMKIGVLELENAIERRLEGAEIPLKRVIDVNHEFKESFNKIDFITGIPGTSQVIVAPTRFEILKIDFLKNDENKESFNNPLDEIKDLIIPFSRQRRTAKHQTSSTKFIATSKFDHINFVGDYTNMSPLRFFTLRKPRLTIEFTTVSDITSDRTDIIEFYGYHPKSQYYLLSNYDFPYVYLYTTVYDKFDDYEILIPGIKVLSWLEDLTYVFYSDKISQCGFWIVHQYEGDPERKIEVCKKNFLKAKEYKLMSFDLQWKNGVNFTFNIPMISVADYYLLLGWDDVGTGGMDHPPSITWPECHTTDIYNNEILKNNLPIFSGFKKCESYRMGVIEQYFAEELDSMKIFGFLVRGETQFKYYKTGENSTWIQKVIAEKDEKILHQT